MIPESLRKYIDWEQTRSEQGHWPNKTMVSVWFKNETNLAVMIDLLRTIKDALKKTPYTIRG